MKISLPILKTNSTLNSTTKNQNHSKKTVTKTITRVIHKPPRIRLLKKIQTAKSKSESSNITMSITKLLLMKVIREKNYKLMPKKQSKNNFMKIKGRKIGTETYPIS